MLQQHLPFTVLKHSGCYSRESWASRVATAPTVYGIETRRVYSILLEHHRVATAPTVYGIETGPEGP